MLKAWTGEPFEYRGTTVRVTPRPFTQPHPMLHARRHEQGRGAPRGAVRPADASRPRNLPELEAYYYEQCEELGTQGFCAMPPEPTPR